MKSLYIFEFSRDDCDVEAEWFVGETSWKYDEAVEACYKYLLESVYDNEETLDDVKKWTKVEAVYPVDEKLIKEVYASY